MEHNFQLSREVDDNSALSIGKFLGAQTIEVQGQYNRNINTSTTISALMKGGKPFPASYGTSRAVSGGTGDQSASAQQAGPKNGTCTFYPRLRAYVGAAQGSYQPPGHSMIPIAANNRNVILQDLDNPAKSYNPVGGRTAGGTGITNRSGMFLGE
ncbi:MAG: hypothetical protein FWG27_05105 [Treponema sp.]|jgi:hypothetical protein|nr:hypothetical protein [Treponema sp.]